MPSISVAEESPVESPGGGPVIGGVQLRRPSSRSLADEPVRTMRELANGSVRAYDVGIRRVVSVSWSKLTGDELDQLRTAVAPPFVTYADDVDAEAFVVSTEEGVDSQAIPGTFPVRYSASTTLREREVRR